MTERQKDRKVWLDGDGDKIWSFKEFQKFKNNSKNSEIIKHSFVKKNTTIKQR